MTLPKIDIENRQESLNRAHNDIGNTTLVICVIFGTIASLFSFIRAFETGLTTANIVQLAILAPLYLLFIFRNRLTGKTKVILVIVMLAIATVSGFLSYGIVSMSNIMTMGILVLTALMFDLKYSLLALFGILSIIVAAGLFHVLGISTISFDFIEYFSRPTSWISRLSATIMISAIIIASLRKMHTYLFTLADTLDASRTDLQASNEELQAMNEEYEAQNRELIHTHYSLIEQEELFRAVFESANDGIFLVDDTDMVFQCNDRIRDLLGNTLEGKQPWSFSPPYQPDGRSSEEAALEAAEKVQNEGSHQFYWRYQHPSGKYVETEISANAMKAGEKVFILGIIRDITAQKKLENQLVQAQKMEALGTLTSGLAHDFNNILGGISGSSGLIETFLQKDDFSDREKLKKYARLINESSQRAAGMIQQLMNLSRFQETALYPLDLNACLDSLMQIIRNSFPKSVEVKAEKYQGTPVIKGDQTQIEQALLNLCINASHAMTIMRPEGEKEGGIITIAIDHIESGEHLSSRVPEAEKGHDYYSIKITDTGIGMDQETRSRLFDPFFTTKEKGTGTGLGLSMVYNIIKNHNGFITVYSDPGVGSAFTIYLPVTGDRESRDTSQGEKEEICSGSEHILVIDDEDVQRTITEGMLLECGYSVTSVPGGKEALEVFRKEENSFDLVITDLSMPEMNGVELYRELRKESPNIRVIITSGFRYDTRIEQGLSEGISSFLEKPFSLSTLSKSVHKALKK